MPGLLVHTGNRMEILAAELARRMAIPCDNPLLPDVVVIQSRAMERFVSMFLARQNRVSANLRFPFPNAFLAEQAGRLIPGFGDANAYDVQAMTFVLLDALKNREEEPGFEEAGTYLKGENPSRRRFQLASILAGLFDRYLAFRPDMLCLWEDTPEDHWQARLWQDVVAVCGPGHVARLKERLSESLSGPAVRLKPGVERVSVFGVSHLPPLYLSLFLELSRVMAVDLYIMNPCREFWADILSEKEARKIRHRTGDHLSAEALHLSPGNPLLASLGKLGRDFFNALLEADADVREHFKEPGCRDMLCTIQSDILNLAEPEEKAGFDPETDPSIRFHSCHGPMREVEVLFDQLLDMFETGGIEPRKVLVMAPDINAYAPYVEAVFDPPEPDAPRIPFTISDQTRTGATMIVKTLFRILELDAVRMDAAIVADVLDTPEIRARFDLSEPDVRLVEAWMMEAGIRWGVDESSRAAAGLPPYRENSFSAGIDRLLLGFAMEPDGRLFNGILPFAGMEPGRMPVLGGFLAFFDRLTAWAEETGRERPLSRWQEVFAGLLNDFFAETGPESQRDLAMAWDALERFSAIEIASGFTGPVDLETARSVLRSALDRRRPLGGFMGGGVTFCSMMPMRSIPFDAICLLGMNYDAFPRQDHAAGFDWMRKSPRHGDRSRRDDDKYLFLEAILSARKRLYISYTGRSPRDNTVLAPSILVSELWDVIESRFAASDGKAPEHLVTDHPIAGFSPRYFKDGKRLFSYSSRNLKSAATLAMPEKIEPVFMDCADFPPDDPGLHASPPQLSAFFANPCRYFLKKRLGIFLDAPTADLEDTEPFGLAGLERYRVDQNLVRDRLAGRPPEAVKEALSAAGSLPPSVLGNVWSDRLQSDAGPFLEAVERMGGAISGQRLETGLAMNRGGISGIISLTGDGRLVRFRYAFAGAADLSALWVEHLILCAAFDTKKSSCFISRSDTQCFEPPEDPMALLEDLWALFRQGLSRPLPLFPKTSMAFADNVLNRVMPTGAALSEAVVKEWESGPFTFGESEDPYIRLCFQGKNPFDAEFTDISLRFFRPLLAHLGPEKGAEGG